LHMCNEMSDVRHRASTARPTLERDSRPAKQGGSAAKPRACRNLFGSRTAGSGGSGGGSGTFGTADSEAAERAAERAFAERWDYDPVTDRPLRRRSPADGEGGGGGGHDWEEVESPPEFYVRPPHKRPRPEERRPPVPRENAGNCL